MPPPTVHSKLLQPVLLPAASGNRIAAARAAADLHLNPLHKHPSRRHMVIDVYNSATDELLGSITEADLQVLVDALEEESSDDQDYYIDAATIDVIGDGRATEHLLNVLRKGLGNAEGVDIRWTRR
jgi:hypothetical protein